MKRIFGDTNFSERYPPVLIALLLFIFLSHVLSILPQKSLTIDEPSNIAVGYAFLKTGDVNLGEDTPPLVRVLSAFPLIFLHPQLPLEDASWRERIHWKFGTVFFDSNPPPLYFRMIFWSRVPMILIAVALGWLVCFVTGKLFGIRAALVALFLYICEPNILANAMLVKTDVASAFVYLWFFYAAWLYVKAPSWRGALHMAIVLAVGMLTKFSLLMLFGLAVIVLCTAFILEQKKKDPNMGRDQRPTLGSFLGHAFAAMMLVIVVLNLGYGLEAFRSDLMHVPLHSSLGRTLSHILPPTMMVGIETVFRVTGAGWPGFLAGEYSNAGWWYYYPFALAIKLPLPMVVFFLAGFFHALFLWIKKREWVWALPLSAVVIYFIPSLTSKVNAGVRHLLPIFPPLFVLSGAMIARVFERGHRASKILVGLLLVALPVLVVKTYPDYLAYFNESIGGPQNGWKYLSDSNLDWGEELPRLAAYVREHKIENVKLAYLGGGDPLFYGIPATLLELPYAWESHDLPQQFSPSPGTYAISVTFLQGTVFGQRRDYFSYFRHQQPVARFGGSLFVYKVP